MWWSETIRKSYRCVSDTESPQVIYGHKSELLRKGGKDDKSIDPASLGVQTDIPLFLSVETQQNIKT